MDTIVNPNANKAPMVQCKAEGRILKLEWIDGSEIRATYVDGTVLVSANREGLLSLAAHLTALAGEAPGTHIHLDAYNSLEDGSEELILERLP